MPTTAEDILLTTFAVRGLSTVVHAMQTAAAATDKVTQAQNVVNAQIAAGNLQLSALRDLQAAIAVETAALAERTMLLAGVMAGVGLAAIRATVRGLHEAIDAFQEFGREVMNVRDLTGASADESVKAITRFKLAGISGTQEIREMLRLGKDAFSSQGLAALGRLGVSANPTQSGLEIMENIRRALNGMQDGLRKTMIMEEIFGARGAANLLPYLRLTDEQIAKSDELASLYNTRMLPAVQQLDFASSNLGQTIMARLVYPLAEKLIPALIWVVDKITIFVDFLGQLNAATGGALGLAAAFFTIAAGVALFIGAMKVLLPLLKADVILEAAMAALRGNWKGLAIAGAVAVGAGILVNNLGPQQEHINATRENTRALNGLSHSVSELADGWDALNRGGIPRGLNQSDIRGIMGAHARGAIG